MKHTKLPWCNGWGTGLTGPTTPADDIFCGGKEWPYTVISKNKETIAIIPKQEDWALEENAAFIVKAVNNHTSLKDALQLAHKYMKLYMAGYSEGFSVFDEIDEAIKQAETDL